MLLDDYIPNPERGYYQIQFVWNNPTFRIMQKGLDLLYRGQAILDSYIESAILGNLKESNESIPKVYENIPDNLNIPGLPELNLSQRTCIKRALQSPLFLIQGPPGTGKTFTITALIYHLVNLNKERILKRIENVKRKFKEGNRSS